MEGVLAALGFPLAPFGLAGMTAARGGGKQKRLYTDSLRVYFLITMNTKRKLQKVE